MTSAIYTAYTAQTVLTSGATIPLGNVVRRFGCIGENGNAVLLRSTGYYDVSATFSLAATEAGTISVQLYKDGLQVEGATATATAAAADTVVLPISALVRQFCCHGAGALSFILTGNATLTNAAVVVGKV